VNWMATCIFIHESIKYVNSNSVSTEEGSTAGNDFISIEW
jgi:hypothetical protein